MFVQDAHYFAGKNLPQLDPTGRLMLTGFALAVGYLSFVAAMSLGGHWLVNPVGQGWPTDFVNVWAAGKLVLDGAPAAAYDWSLHKAVENAAVGHAFGGYFGWHYPPPFLFAAALLALLPYAPACLVWMAATLPAYLLTIQRILPARESVLLACAFPAVLLNLWVGQNGFLTAALIGGALLLMEKRPVAAGCLLGLLTYKPQLGLLFPIVLIAAGQWRVFASASVTALLLALLSLVAFGAETWSAFFASLPVTTDAVLANGMAGWNKLQSMFGLVRWLGGSYEFAWLMQGLVAATVAGHIWIIWRKPIIFELKAAALASSALLVTPYAYVYDSVVLAVAAAFLLRLDIATGIARREAFGIAGAAALLLAFPWTNAPVGLASALIVFRLVAQRARESRREILSA